MNLENIRKKYAEVIVRTGVNLQEGQPLLIRTETGQRDFARILAREAYRRGASMVQVKFHDPVLRRIRIDESLKDGYLDFTPSHVPDMYDRYIEDGWCSVSLRGPQYPDVMEGADPDRVGRAGKALSLTMRRFLKGISANRIAWNVCLHPSREWSEKVLGHAGDDLEEDIWRVLVPILRLDAPDPAEAWLKHDSELKRRCGYMNKRRFDRIHFVGPGTDLYVGMAPNRIFAGGRCRNSSGVDFFPNIPTEEIFSTPDHTRTCGEVRTTRPVEVLGTQVKGAWFRFDNGSVVDFGADENSDVLDRYLDFDAGARALGEVALVGTESPIYQSGKIFHNILFDENASSHIALGNGYADCIEGGTSMSDEQLEETRCNLSLVHTDFMIGSGEVSVYGVSSDGAESPIIENGKFVI